jgi:hypothetical protein
MRFTSILALAFLAASSAGALARGGAHGGTLHGGATAPNSNPALGASWPSGTATDGISNPNGTFNPSGVGVPGGAGPGNTTIFPSGTSIDGP